MGEVKEKFNWTKYTCVVTPPNQKYKQNRGKWTVNDEALKNMKQAVVFNIIGLLLLSWGLFSLMLNSLVIPIYLIIIIALLPWCWGIPSTIHIINKIKEKRLPKKSFMIFNLFLVCFIGGILLLLAEDEFYK